MGDADIAKSLQIKLCEAIKNKLSQCMEDLSLRNMLLDYYILFTDATDLKAQINLTKMAESGSLPGQETHGKVVNKTQRYACLRKLVQLKGISGMNGLINDEKSTEYSAGDDTEVLKLEAADPS